MGKYCPEIVSEIAQYLQNGSNRTDAAVLAGINFDTFNEWRKEHPEFSDAIKKAEATCKNRNIAIVQKAAITTWQAAAWWLERKHPEEFALKDRERDKGRDEEIPQKMAERAAELLKKIEGRKPVVSNSNGNGIHP